MRLLICGTRDVEIGRAFLWDWVYAVSRLSGARGLHEILVGDCPTGADAAVRDFYGESLGLRVLVFRANWEKYGPSAGPIRNQEMINAKPDAVLALWDGRSNGTLDTIRRAAKSGICTVIAPIKRAVPDSVVKRVLRGGE